METARLMARSPVKGPIRASTSLPCLKKNAPRVAPALIWSLPLPPLEERVAISSSRLWAVSVSFIRSLAAPKSLAHESGEFFKRLATEIDTPSAGQALSIIAGGDILAKFLG